MDKVFFDTAPFIYLIEKNPSYHRQVIDFVIRAAKLDLLFVTSVISYLEFSVKPERENRQDLIESFEQFINEAGFEVIMIDLAVAKTAAKLRGKYNFLKTIDALQIAAAIKGNCKVFYTNDQKLSNINELKIEMIS